MFPHYLLCLFYYPLLFSLSFFFFNDTATTEIYTLSLHDALPIYDDNGGVGGRTRFWPGPDGFEQTGIEQPLQIDRKSTRLNSSHANISYAVFCLKKKKRYRSEWQV